MIFDQNEFISRHIPYRMDVISQFITLEEEGLLVDPSARKMLLYVDGKPILGGNLAGFTNSCVEMALMYSRVLLDFVGIVEDKSKASTGKKLVKQRAALRFADDIGIELVHGAHGALKAVTPAEAFALFDGSFNEAEIALYTVIEHASKGVAHLTTGPDRNSPEVNLRIFAGCKLTLRILERHLFLPLGLSMPPGNSRTVGKTDWVNQFHGR